MTTGTHVDAAQQQHRQTCPVCWLQRELDFASNEFSRYPQSLEDGLDAMLGGLDGWRFFHKTSDSTWRNHELISEDNASRFADAAEFTAAWRNTCYKPSIWTVGKWPQTINGAPTRQRVIEYMAHVDAGNRR